MSESFAKLFEETFASQNIKPGTIIKGTIVEINNDVVVVNAGLKSEAIIPLSQFHSEKDSISVNDEIEVALDAFEDGFGETRLSREKAIRARSWINLQESQENDKIINGFISGRVKGGFTVEIDGIRAFLPGSLVDVRPVRDPSYLEGKTVELKVIKVDKQRNNVVVSRKAVVETEFSEERSQLLENIKEGGKAKGIIKNLTDYGAFVDLGGIDGLLHITDISWGRINHPSEVINLNDTISVKVIEYDEERKRVSLGLKQLIPHPWEDLDIKYPVGNLVKGKVVSLTNYGCFIEIEPGVEGLIHVSEISWTKHIKNPSEVYSMGDEIEAKILSIDSEEKKISLGVKQLLPDPWDLIEEKYMVDTVHKCIVRNLTQFGAFAELEDGIDGLIHVSDLSWTKVVKHPKEVLEKGQNIDVSILEISRENRRISLGYRQVLDNPWPDIINHYETGNEVSGEIIRVLDKGIIIQLEMNVEGIIPFGKMSKKDRKVMANQYEVGANLSGIVMKVSPEDKKVILYKEELAGGSKNNSANNEVKQYLKDQNIDATEKLDLPKELLEIASQAEKDGVSDK